MTRCGLEGWDLGKGKCGFKKVGWKEGKRRGEEGKENVRSEPVGKYGLWKGMEVSN